MKNILLSTLLFFGFAGLHAQVEQATLLGQWSDDSLVGSNTYDNAYNEIWGVAVNNREYAVIGSTFGTHFIDITDPSNPVEVQVVKGAVSGPVIIHRDYHDNGEGILYAVADEPTNPNLSEKSTLQIMDMRNLPGPVEVLYDSDELIFRSHNIFLDEPNKRLYAFIANGAGLGFSAMRIYDISDPANPVFLALHNSLAGINIQQVHDGYVLDHIAYLNLGPGGFAVADFTDAANPVILGTLDNYPEQGYNHSGWLSQDGDYYYMADENHGRRMKVVDVRDPTDMEVINFMDAGNPSPTSIPHNQIVACDYLYVSYYYDGLQVYDISDPANPVRIAEYDTSKEPDANNFKGAWGVYPFLPSGNVLVADMQEGLFVFEAIDKGPCDQRRGMLNGVSTREVTTNNSLLSIHPNPATDFITITNADTNPTEAEVSIQDITGKVIWLKQMDLVQGGNTIALPQQVAAGIYLLSVRGDGFIHTERLVVE